MENNRKTVKEKIKRAYYYLFYTLYKWYEGGPFIWASDWKACISIIVLQIWGIISLISYYNVFIDRFFNLDRTFSLIMALVISYFNTNIFTFSNKWRWYMKEFDQLPKSINRKWRIITWGIILLVIANVVFSFYLMSRVDWEKYR